ncbi:hypothetical protein L195_g000022 [Trifolium pratense]|uniref:Uncharacterized protein n=1 Tax=Trifolium pratense TaxID=57577 RepID=A0A2K3NKQ6_TRIPR|nr:hypothetical protein L195_g000022 [Trifolium pratense]
MRFGIFKKALSSPKSDEDLSHNFPYFADLPRAEFNVKRPTTYAISTNYVSPSDIASESAYFYREPIYLFSDSEEEDECWDEVYWDEDYNKITCSSYSTNRRINFL